MRDVEKYNGYVIYEDDGATDDFYCRMGRFFADRNVIKELEGPMYDDPGYVWFIAMKDGEVAAFASVHFNELDKGIANFGVVYVMPQHRRNGLAKKLFELRQKICIKHNPKEIRALANPVSALLFEEFGWRPVRKNGKWTHYRMEARNGS